MNKEDVIVITGAAGFIGSCLTGFLNDLGFDNLILVDDFSEEKKFPNFMDKKYIHKIERETFFNWVNQYPINIKYCFHLGARTDTTEMDYTIHKRLNLDYSKKIWSLCVSKNIPLVYASSAATYGNGELGYQDNHEIIHLLKPLNPYGISKNEFDIWALEQIEIPPFWAGLKFFNVYGPNEYHKNRMASVIYHGYQQIKSNGTVKLFRSHNNDYKDGEQLRDFIYVKDVLNVCVWLMENAPKNGIYNLGTGEARTFKALVQAIFNTIHLQENIQYIDTPIDIRDKYQYFTEADMDKLRSVGYHFPFYTLEEGVGDYVTQFLETKKYF